MGEPDLGASQTRPCSQLTEKMGYMGLPQIGTKMVGFLLVSL